MKVSGKDLVITDPCYFAKGEDWGEMFNWWEDFCIEDSFTEYEWEQTGYGNGSPKVFSIPTYYDPSDYVKKMREDDEETMNELLSLRNDIGQCKVDSGSFGVFLLEEILAYNSDIFYKLPEHYYCIIGNFTGEVSLVYDKDECAHFIFKPEDPNTQPIITD